LAWRFAHSALRAGVYDPERSHDLPSAAARSLIADLRQPRRLAAIGLLALAGGLVVAFDYARGDRAAADAIAYWQAVHTWLNGGDIYRTIVDPSQASGVILPYAYPPWTLVLFLPWALLPWPTAWFVWRWGSVLLFGWTARWAYQRRPLGTAVMIAILGPALAANFDSGNVNIVLTLAVWAAQFVGPRLGGTLWAVATAVKWLPGALFAVLSPRARAFGLVALAIALLLELATWPETLRQIDIALNYPRPLRLDYMLLLWAAVPWLWAQPWPPWWLQSREILARWRARRPLRPTLRRLLGLEAGSGG
jgi:hypothetical protein